MILGKAMPQMSEQLELALFDPGATRETEDSGEAMLAEHTDELSGEKWTALMERVVTPSNLKTALKRVRQNKGSPVILCNGKKGPFRTTFRKIVPDPSVLRIWNGPRSPAFIRLESSPCL